MSSSALDLVEARNVTSFTVVRLIGHIFMNYSALDLVGAKNVTSYTVV